MVYLGYQLSIKNWVGLLEIMVIYSNFKAFLKYRVKPYVRYKRTKRNEH